jgi:hypothetical protein
VKVIGRSIMSCILVAVAFGATTPSAMAASGDSASDPIVLPSSLPQSVWVDTTSATAEPEDPSQLCVGWGPSELRLDATTFYTYTATRNTFLLSDARSPGGTAPHASVYTYDSSGTLVQWGCSNGWPDRLILPAGQTYLIMMGTCCEPQGVDGGLAELSLTEQPPPLDIDVQVTGALVDKKSGAATVYGTVTCNILPSYGVQVSGGELRQQVKGTKAFVVYRFNSGFSCDPSAPTRWSIALSPDSGAYSVGTAHVFFSWQGWDDFTTDSGYVDMDIRLEPSR